MEAPDVSRWEVHSKYLGSGAEQLREAPDVSRREIHPLRIAAENSLALIGKESDAPAD